MTTGEPRWTIAELSERVSAALAEVEYEPPANGQVRAVPDLRTIRYYTTLGLLDRPSAMQGRTALYGRRHLLQLVAVKRLQAQGKSLSEVQAALTGLDDGALAAIAAVTVPAAADVSVSPSDARRDARFWAAAPASAAVEPATRASSRTRARIESAPPRRSTISTMARIDLAPGVSLVVELAGAAGAFHQLARSIDPAELARAAAPLLETLRRHGLATEDHEEEERG